MAFTAFSRDSNSLEGKTGSDSAASKAASSVPLGGINRSITAENDIVPAGFPRSQPCISLF